MHCGVCRVLNALEPIIVFYVREEGYDGIRAAAGNMATDVNLTSSIMDVFRVRPPCMARNDMVLPVQTVF